MNKIFMVKSNNCDALIRRISLSVVSFKCVGLHVSVVA